jgi:ADP-heptose:LPS heptosyltransferase
MLKYIQINNPKDDLKFYLPPTPSNKIIEFKKQKEKKLYIGFNTEGSHEDRTLSKNQIVNICNILKHSNIQIILFCTPDKRNFFKEIISHNKLNNTIISYETKNIYDAAELVQELDLMITPDTSFVHIASGLKIPVLGLYANKPLLISIWAPYNVPYEIVTPKEKDVTSIKEIDIKELKTKAFKLLNI